jgi:MFS family permease
MAYALGAYVAYPILAAVGGALLSRADTRGKMAAAGVVLAGAMALPPVLGRYCRRCGERLMPRLLRLLIMPVAIMTALGFRTPQHQEQYIAFALVGFAAMAFISAWQLSAPAAPATEKENPEDGQSKPEN